MDSTSALESYQVPDSSLYKPEIKEIISGSCYISAPQLLLGSLNLMDEIGDFKNEINRHENIIRLSRGAKRQHVREQHQQDLEYLRHDLSLKKTALQKQIAPLNALHLAIDVQNYRDECPVESMRLAPEPQYNMVKQLCKELGETSMKLDQAPDFPTHSEMKAFREQAAKTKLYTKQVLKRFVWYIERINAEKSEDEEEEEEEEEEGAGPSGAVEDEDEEMEEDYDGQEGEPGMNVWEL